jgi:hypothetical protein
MDKLLLFGSITIAVLSFLGLCDMIKRKNYNLLEYFICVDGMLIGITCSILIMFYK